MDYLLRAKVSIASRTRKHRAAPHSPTC